MEGGQRLKKKEIAFAVVVLFLLGSVIPVAGIQTDTELNSGPNERSIIETTTKKWTWMFYDDADFHDGPFVGFNPMDSPGYCNVTFADETYSGENIDVIVLEDTYGGPSKIWYIDESHNKELLEELGEVNMGDYITLRDFIQYGKENYPAERYFLSVYNHGGGWNGACRDDTSDGDSLSMNEFQKALKEVDGVDVICFTGPCSMGSLESAYELRDYTKLYIGSEDASGYVYWHGTIGHICNLLNGTPDILIDELGKEIIENIKKADYENYIFPNIGNRIWIERVKLCVTISAIRTDTLENVAIAVDKFAKDLMDKINTSRFALSQIRLARQVTKSFGILFIPLIMIKGFDVDIYDFSKKCSLVFFLDSTIKQDAKAVMESIDEAVIANLHGVTQLGAYGLKIYFPRSFFYNSNIANRYSSELNFANNTHWDEFLEFYHNK